MVRKDSDQKSRQDSSSEPAMLKAEGAHLHTDYPPSGQRNKIQLTVRNSPELTWKSPG